MPWRFLFGTLVLGLGLGMLLEQMQIIPGYTLLTFLQQWWPLVVALVGLNQLIRHKERPWGSLIVFAVGIVLLAYSLKKIPNNPWAFLGGIGLLMLGLRMLLPRNVRRFRSDAPTPTTPKAMRFAHQIRDAQIFGGTHFRNESQQFQGGKVSVLLGDYEVDLRGAMLAPRGADLELQAIAGTIALRVPEHMTVALTGSPFMGTIENTTHQLSPVDDGRPVLRVKCRVAGSAIAISN